MFIIVDKNVRKNDRIHKNDHIRRQTLHQSISLSSYTVVKTNKVLSKLTKFCQN
jgi:hypothetical protein